MTKEELDALENMACIARNVSGSAVMSSDYGWSKDDEKELDAAEAILAKYGRG